MGEGGHTGSGWCMKELKPWLEAALKKAGEDFFDGKPTGSYGMGGSISSWAGLERLYPSTQVVALGLKKAYAHEPNEIINLTYAKKLTCALASVIHATAVN